MMAINRYRLASRTQGGYRPAILTQRLLQQTDRLPGVILPGNQDIPDAGTCLIIDEHRLEIVQTQGRSIWTVRLIPSQNKPCIC